MEQSCYVLCDTWTKNGLSMWVVAMMVSPGLGLGFAGSTSNLRFCIIMVKKMKRVLLARDSPRHILFPIPKGVN